MVKLVHTSKNPDSGKPHADRPTKKQGRARRGLKFFLLSSFALIFFSSGWFTYKVASATGKIFTENTTGGSPLLQGKKLKDDAEGRINILLLGIGGEGHDGPNLTDTIQVASVDPRAKQIAILSVPRDLYVQIPDSLQKVKVNEVHAIGEDLGTEGGGPGLVKRQVSQMLDVPIHYFVRADFQGFKQLVDAVGGVDINVTERLYDPYYPRGTGYQVLDVYPGVRHMDGELALKYVRSRETTSDFDRSKRQQQVMIATRDKALNLQFLTNPAKISELIDVLGERVKTDLSVGEMQRLAGIVKDIPETSVTSKVLDNGPNGLLYDSTGPGGVFILLPRSGDYGDIREFTRQLFEGSAVTSEKAALELLNSSGRGGLAAEEASILAGYGYHIVSTGNGLEITPQSIIYDFTNGAKPATVKALEKRYKAQVVRQPAPAPGIEIRVSIGTEYTTQASGRGSQ